MKTSRPLIAKNKYEALKTIVSEIMEAIRNFMRSFMGFSLPRLVNAAKFFQNFAGIRRDSFPILA